jgi:hypothetical protein
LNGALLIWAARQETKVFASFFEKKRFSACKPPLVFKAAGA